MPLMQIDMESPKSKQIHIIPVFDLLKGDCSFRWSQGKPKAKASTPPMLP